MSDVALIEIHNATIFRGATCVFDRFNLTLQQHEPVAILGPNGSGKTTLLKVINRELYPVLGEATSVRILGRENWNVWELRSHIGIVSHDLQAHYHPHATGLDVVLSGFLSSIGIHGLLSRLVTDEQRERACTILRDLGAGDLSSRPFDRMSTGQQRRCLLGRALVHEPHTLILDEPMAGLDLAAAFDYLRRIRSLAESGRNIVLVCHSPGEIPPEIERVVLLREGRIVADGRREQVLTEDRLQQAYGVPVRVRCVDGYYFTYPADAPLAADERAEGASGA